MGGETKRYRYLIVGGGMTADSAARGIRSVDPSGSIGLIGAEPDPPYNRPPLSKGLWKGKPVAKISRRTGERGVEMHLGRRAASLDPEGHCVTGDQGDRYFYDKLLLATGGFPRRLPFDQGQLAPGDGIIYFRTLQDYRRLREAVDRGVGKDFIVVGGGFIGSEVAAALAMNERRVTMIFPDEYVGQRIYPPGMAEFVTDYYRQKGVVIANRSSVVAAEQDGAALRLAVRDEQTGVERSITGHTVVAGIGIIPAVELAEAAGLKVDNGIVVDAGLQTSHAGIYAAGDVARFYNSALDKWMRVEHEDNANTMGTMAGKAMAGEPVKYEYIPYFYSDLFDLGYEAVGELDSRLETVADWAEPFRKGIVYYLRDDRVRGVLFVNVWGKRDAGRALIAEPGFFQGADLIGRIEMD